MDRYLRCDKSVFPLPTSDVVMIGNPGCDVQLFIIDDTSILVVSLHWDDKMLINNFTVTKKGFVSTSESSKIIREMLDGFQLKTNRVC